MVLVKGSTFQMGSKDQKPIHSVMLHDFYISKYEVTQRQWRMVMGKTRPIS
ncbi:MAG: SUMF1/EgtB/PvdO family nonheme iron enzyme [Spirosomataceae bacterium]